MEIIAHRGASHDAPENTLAALSLAWKQNADAVEINVQFSKDGRIVVIHDDDTRRTAGRMLPVAAQTLKQLRALDAGKWKAARWSGERIPTLAEAMDAVPEGKRLFVEIKCGPECRDDFQRTLRRSRIKPEQLVIIGFGLGTMALFKSELPKLEVCWAAAFKRNAGTGRWTPKVEKFIEQVKTAGLDGLDFGVRGPLTAALVEKLRAAGLKTYVWTVDSGAKARALAKAGIDGITTNRPGWLREQLRQSTKP